MRTCLCSVITLALLAGCSSSSLVYPNGRDHIQTSAPILTDSPGKTGQAASFSVFRVICPKRSSGGTAFLHKSGKVITAAHIVRGCDAKDIFLLTAKGNRIKVSQVVIDLYLDLALLTPKSKIGGNPLSISSCKQFTIGSQISTWGYKGRRFRKSVGSAETAFIYDDWSLIQESNNSITNSYIWGLDLSQTLSGAGGVGGLLSGVEADGGVYYPTFDANGNITDYIDTNGIAVAHYDYNGFGNELSASGSKMDDFAFRFSTKYLDKTGLYYYGYRYYRPSLGVWISRDPIGQKYIEGLYAFSHNNPVGLFDMLGLFVKVWPPQKGDDGWCGAYSRSITYSKNRGQIIIQQVSQLISITSWKKRGDLCCPTKKTEREGRTFWEEIKGMDFSIGPDRGDCTKGIYIVMKTAVKYDEDPYDEWQQGDPNPTGVSGNNYNWDPPPDWGDMNPDGHIFIIMAEWDCSEGNFRSLTKVTVVN